jgi:hypothetical protein
MADNVTGIDSSFTPIQTTATPAAPPAATPQAAPVAGIDSTFTPIGSQSSENPIVSGLNKIGEVAGKTLFGENTALGAPASPTQQAEASGISDVLHGNVKQGVGKLYQSEVGSLHIVQGSPIEKMIQKFDPTFKGGITPSQAEAEHHANYAGIENPALDVAQHIDKNAHPVLKAITESAQSLTSPVSVATLISTGGLGLVDSPQGLATANRLLSAGFSAQAVGQAYKNFKDFKQAYDKGDATEALYQLTHAVLSGAMAYTAGAHAAGSPLEAVSQTDKAAVTQMAGAAQPFVDAAKGVGQTIAGAAGKVADLAKGPAETAPELVGKITQGTGEDIDTASRALKNVDTSKVETFNDLHQVLDKKVRENTAQINNILSQNPKLFKVGDLEKTTPVQGGTPIVTNPVQDGLDQLHDYFTKTNDVQGEAEVKALQTKLETTGLTAKEINDLARMHGNELNAYNASGELASGLSKQAAENTRQGIKEQVRRIEPKIQDIDSKTSDMITTRGLAEDMIEKVQKLQNKIQKAGLLERAGSALGTAIDVGTGGALKTLLKHFIANGQEAEGAGTPIDIENSLRKNLDKLDKLNSMTPQAAAAALKSGALNIKVNLPNEIQEPAMGMPSDRIPRGHTPESVLRHEWGHALVAHKEGFGSASIKSHYHPDVAPSERVGAATEVHFDGLDQGPDGLIKEDAFKANLHRILPTILGGAAADEVLSGIPFDKNNGLYGDKEYMKKIFRGLNVGEAEAKELTDAAFERAKSHVQDPHASDIINENASVREPGLPKEFHASGQRISEAMAELDRRQNEGNDTGNEENNAQHGKSNDSGKEGGSSSGTAEASRYEVYDPKTGDVIGDYKTPKRARRVADKKDLEYGAVRYGVRPKKNLNMEVAPEMLHEKSTGDEKMDDAIRQAGGIPGGNFLNYVQFHDPETGSSLMLKPEDITPANVKAHLMESRERFGK